MTTADSPSPEHCANCGTGLPPGARFCGTCGTPRADAPGEPAVPVTFIDDAATAAGPSFPPPVNAAPPAPPPRPVAAGTTPPVRVPRPLASAPSGLILAAVVAAVFAVLSVIGGLVAWDDSGITVGYGETVGRNAGFIVWGIAVGALWAMVCVFCAGLHSHLDRLARIMLASPSERRAATASPAPVAAAPRRQPPPGLTPEEARAWERQLPVWERS